MLRNYFGTTKTIENHNTNKFLSMKNRRQNTIFFKLFYGSCTSTLRYAQRLKDNSLIAAAKQIRAVRELDQQRFIL